MQLSVLLLAWSSLANGCSSSGDQQLSAVLTVATKEAGTKEEEEEEFYKLQPANKTDQR